MLCCVWLGSICHILSSPSLLRVELREARVSCPAQPRALRHLPPHPAGSQRPGWLAQLAPSNLTKLWYLGPTDILLLLLCMYVYTRTYQTFINIALEYVVKASFLAQYVQRLYI